MFHSGRSEDQSPRCATPLTQFKSKVQPNYNLLLRLTESPFNYGVLAAFQSNIDKMLTPSFCKILVFSVLSESIRANGSITLLVLFFNMWLFLLLNNKETDYTSFSYCMEIIFILHAGQILHLILLQPKFGNR